LIQSKTDTHPAVDGCPFCIQNAPIIWIQHETPNQEILRFQSPGWQLPDSLNQDQSDFYVRKTTPDSFLKTDLLQILTSQAVTELVVCGYATEFCVDTTIQHMINHTLLLSLSFSITMQRCQTLKVSV
jgi:nicotinamidase-related amidase